MSYPSGPFLLDEIESPDVLFYFVWMLHGSTKFVVRTVALLSAKHSEKESFRMIGIKTSFACYGNNKTWRNTENCRKERRQPHRGCQKQE